MNDMDLTLGLLRCEFLKNEGSLQPMDQVIVRALVILAVAYIAVSVLDGMHKDWLKSCQKEKLGEVAELLGELAIVVVGLFLFVLVGRLAFI